MFECVILIEKQTNLAPSCIMQYPPNVIVRNSSIVSFLTFPSSLDLTKSEVFSFNINNAYYFSYSFLYEESKFSIVISSNQLYASLFFDFLHSVQDSFINHKVQNDPICRFALVKSLLLSWSTDDKNNLLVNFPYNTFSINLNTIPSWFVNFNPAPLYPYLNEVWLSTLANDGVLIIAPSAEIASSSVFSVISMLDKLKYSDTFLIYTERGDPRFQEVLENNLPYKIVGTTDPTIANGESKFSAIITVRAQNFENMFPKQLEYRTKTIRLFGYLLIQMNVQLMANPYSDMLNTELNVNDLVRISSGEFPAELFSRVQKTKTFYFWRRHLIDRDNLRDAFLSVPPKEAIKVLNEKIAPNIFKMLKTISNTYIRDQHFLSVIKIHQNTIIKKFKIQSQVNNEILT